VLTELRVEDQAGPIIDLPELGVLDPFCDDAQPAPAWRFGAFDWWKDDEGVIFSSAI
jgi:hypothetical protein